MLDRTIPRPLRAGTTLFATLCAFTLQAFAQDAMQLNNQGVEYFNEKRWEEAIKTFRSAVRLSPESDTIRINLANAIQEHANTLVVNERYDEATNVLREAVRVAPELAEPLIQMGFCHLMEGETQAAINRLEEAIEVAPGSADAHFLLGEAYFRDHDVSSALVQWEWVKTVAPDMPGLDSRLESARKDEEVEGGFRTYASRHFVIRYSKEVSRATRQRIVTMLESAYTRIGRTLGNAFPPGPIAVTLYTADSFGEVTNMGSHVGALYDGARIRCPVVDKNGRVYPMEEIERRLTHEYVHAVVRHVARDNVPWWFNEGLAETLSDRATDRDFAMFQRAYKNDALVPLETLHDEQLDKLDVDRLRLAYLQSHLTVEYIRHRYGERRLGQLLRGMESNDDPEAVLRRVCRTNYGMLESGVLDWTE